MALTTLSDVAEPTQVVGRPSPRQHRWLGWAPFVAAVVPVVVIVARPLFSPPVGSDYGDVAAQELSVQRALRLHQTLGPYDRFGWYHPGPALAYALAPWYALVGERPAGLAVGATLINAACAAAIIVVVGRRMGRPAALAGAAIVVAWAAVLGVPQLTNAWSPVVITLPSALFAVLCVDAACGTDWAVPGLLLVGSALVQTEVALTPVVLAGVVVVVVRNRRWLARRRVLLTAAAALAVLWSAPIQQQLTGRPGNISALVQFFTEHRGHQTLSTALNAVAAGLVGGVTTGGAAGRASALGGDGWRLAAGLAIVVGSAVWAARRRRGFAAFLGVTSVVLAAVYGVALLSAADQVRGYLVQWMGGLTLCALLAVVLSARVPVAVALVGLLAAATWLAVDAGHHPIHDQFGSVTAAAAQVGGVVPEEMHHVLVCIADAGTWPAAAGVVADLRARGWDVRVDRPWLHMLGASLHRDGTEAAMLDIATARSAPPPNAAFTRVASAGGLDLFVTWPDRAGEAVGPCPAPASSPSGGR